MKRTISTVVAALMIISLVGCATTPKVAIKPEVKQSIQRIAIVEIPEPENYFMRPCPSPSSGVLMLFGAVGGAIAGGIEAKRQNTATVKFTEAIAPLEPALAETMFTVMEKRLTEKKYDVLRVSPPPMTPDGEKYDLSKIKGAFDAILVSKLTGGYWESFGEVTPTDGQCLSVDFL